MAQPEAEARLLEALRARKWTGSKRRVNITDAPRDATGRYLADPVWSEVLGPKDGDLRARVDACTPHPLCAKQMIVINRS